MNDTIGHVLVVGNEKGGSGKSTTAMHLAIGLLKSGYRVAVIDADVRQGSLKRFVSNRADYLKSSGHHLVAPELLNPAAGHLNAEMADDVQVERLEALVNGGRQSHDVVLIDTPGAASVLSEHAHGHADTLVTPLNDSFVDLDVLARVNPKTMSILAPSRYAEMVWKQKLEHARTTGRGVDWVVLRNRLSTLDSHNRREMERLLTDLAKRIGFRFLPGFGERVIFRELFLAGLTIMDVREAGGRGLNMSRVAARQEVRRLIAALKLPAAPALTMSGKARRESVPGSVPSGVD